MSGREYGIRNRYGYLEFLDEDAIETVANFDGCVDVLGPADEIRSMGYTKGDTIPPSADVTKVSSRSQLASASPLLLL